MSPIKLSKSLGAILLFATAFLQAQVVTSGGGTSGPATGNVTVNGQTCALGGSCTVTANPANLPAAGSLLSTPDGTTVSGAIPDGTTVILNGGKLSALPTVASSTPGYTSNTLLSGGGVAWTSGYSFTVSAATYAIGGATYASAQTNVTLASANASFDRIDVIVVNTSGAVAVVQGSASSNPQAPSVDPSSQLQLTFVYVTAASTQPSTINLANIYNENTEYTTSGSASWNFASTANPFAGTKSVAVTNAATADSGQFTVPSSGTVSLSAYNSLVFYVAPSTITSWAKTRTLTLQWYSNTTPIGSPISFGTGSFGFNIASATYQQIIIPLSQFAVPSTVAPTSLKISVAGTGANMGLYLDKILLQGGVSSSNLQTAMTWQGAWASSRTYNTNDVVVYSNNAYICTVSNTNVLPTNTSVWIPLQTSATPPVTFTAPSASITPVIVKGSSAAPSSAGTFVQATPGASGPSSLSMTFPANVAAGNTLWVFIYSDVANPVISSITDTQGDTLSLQHSYCNPNWGAYPYQDCLLVYGALGTVGGPTTVNVNFSDSGNNHYGATAVEYSGLAIVTPIDAASDVSMVTSGSTTALAMGPITTTTTFDKLLAIGNIRGTATPPTGYTSRVSGNGINSAPELFYLADNAANTIGSYSATWTGSWDVNQGQTTGILLAIKPLIGEQVADFFAVQNYLGTTLSRFDRFGSFVGQAALSSASTYNGSAICSTATGCGGSKNITGSVTATGCTISGNICTVSTATNAITFSAIPGTYSDLQIISNARVSDASDREGVTLQLNADTTTTNYTAQSLYGNNTSVVAATVTNTPCIVVAATSAANASSPCDLTLYNYSNTTFTKNFWAKSSSFGSAGGSVYFDYDVKGFWGSTAAITSVKLLDAGGGNFVAGSTFRIIGVQ